MCKILDLLTKSSKTREASINWFTINYNSINTGPSQNIKIFSEVVVGSKCGPIEKIEEQTLS